jgi:hypothetical protein
MLGATRVGLADGDNATATHALNRNNYRSISRARRQALHRLPDPRRRAAELSDELFATSALRPVGE